MKRSLFLLIMFWGLILSFILLSPPTRVHAQCGGNFPPCPPPACGEPNGPECPEGGNKKKQPTPYPSYTPTATVTPTNTPTSTATATPLACLPPAGANEPNQSATGTNSPSLFPGLLLGGGGIFLGGILIGLLVAGIIGPSMGVGSRGAGEGELVPAVNKGGIIGPVDNAGIIGPVDNAGSSRSVNGDYPPGPPADRSVNGDYPPGPPNAPAEGEWQTAFHKTDGQGGLVPAVNQGGMVGPSGGEGNVFHKHTPAPDMQPDENAFFKYDRSAGTPGGMDGTEPPGPPQLQVREAALNAREAALNAREAALSVREAALRSSGSG